MRKIRAAGIIYGPVTKHLDHIAPLCILMKIPLFVTELATEKIAKRYYPSLVVFYCDYLEIAREVASQYEVVFSALPRALFDEIFFITQNLLYKSLVHIWCPHGNSDKGHLSSFMEVLSQEKIALVYGQKMIDLLIEKKVYSELYASITLGNFRYQLYKQYAPFYRQLIKEQIAPHLVKGNRTLLYAPTWEDGEDSCSLFSAFPKILNQLPKGWNLIVKPHPNTLENPHYLESLIHQVQNKPNVLFLKLFPPIYPLLEYVDAYLGDMSSIGYDFLTFNKPLFFLNQNRWDPKSSSLYLFQCGRVISPNDYSQIFSIIEEHFEGDQKHFQKMREEAYFYVFGKEQNAKALRSKIEDVYEQYLQESFPLL